jgi:hypothetical protein
MSNEWNMEDEGGSGVEFPEDCERIVQILAKEGYVVTSLQAGNLWAKRSNEWSAGFLVLPKDDMVVFGDLLKYCGEYLIKFKKEDKL